LSTRIQSALFEPRVPETSCDAPGKSAKRPSIGATFVQDELPMYGSTVASCSAPTALLVVTVKVVR
jgi:hypothetical protein